MVSMFLKQWSFYAETMHHYGSRIITDFKTGEFKIPAGGIENCDLIGSRLTR